MFDTRAIYLSMTSTLPVTLISLAILFLARETALAAWDSVHKIIPHLKEICPEASSAIKVDYTALRFPMLLFYS